MSSSSANTLRRPARKMACVSATMTRTNWPLPPSSPAPRFSSTLTGMVAIQFLCAYARSKWYSSITTPTPRRPRSSKLRTTRPRQSICTSPPRTHNIRGQQNREIHHRAHRNVLVHRKQHAVGRDVFRLRRVRAALALHRRGEVQRKARRTLHIFVVPSPSSRAIGHRCCAFCCHAEKNLPSGSAVSALRTLIQLKGSVHPQMGQTKLPKSWNKWGLTDSL